MTARIDRYDSLIAFYWQESAERHGFAEDPIVTWRLGKAQMIAESGDNGDVNPEAVSPVGARGLFQIMPSTWGEGFTEHAFNPEASIRKGLAVLGDMWAIFKAERGLTRWQFALGAYNAGPKHIIDAQALLAKRGQQTDAWSGVAGVLPELTGADNAAQTRNYVRTIMARFLSTKDTA